MRLNNWDVALLLFVLVTPVVWKIAWQLLPPMLTPTRQQILINQTVTGNWTGSGIPPEQVGQSDILTAKVTRHYWLYVFYELFGTTYDPYLGDLLYIHNAFWTAYIAVALTLLIASLITHYLHPEEE